MPLMVRAWHGPPAQATEHLPTQDVDKLVDGSGLRGVEVRFFPKQQGVRASKGYDWHHLSGLWHEYLAAEEWIPWRPYPPRKRMQRETDRVDRLKELGAPSLLGNGYGEGQAKLSGEVEFGARFVLPPTTTLAEATQVRSRVAITGSRVARHPVAPRTTPTGED
ncbi:hypothetical protein [Nocardioides sp. BE266]|uniref:hypothetical protein n=1 Tax=Nocardioides sp. BE266 TaxID=2817725 RepID=UPI00286D1793|nr:hypothetical protein [Nocardioides sp. BE266]